MSSAPSRRLALGTVQFGLAYGVANATGQIGLDEAAAIVRTARELGLDTLDTAIAYGESESRLGTIGVEDWRVVTKLPGIPDGCADVGRWVRESVLESLARLAIRRLAGLLLHRADQLLGAHGAALHDAMRALREEDLVEKIGVSIYGPEELDALCPRYRFDLVQAPFNVLDRRLADSGWLRRLHDEGTEVHVRSVFLQGLLLMDAPSRPHRFQRWAPLWNEWHGWLCERKLTAVQGALGFALGQREIARVVVGVDSLRQLRDIVSTATGALAEPPRTLASDDVRLINPSRWSEL